MKNRTLSLLAFIVVALLSTGSFAQNAITRSLFDPDLYLPLNGGLDLTLQSGDTLVIDTSALTITRNGVSLGTGVVGNTAGSSPQAVALFTFSNLTIPSGVTVTISGSRPLGLLSRGSMTLNSYLPIYGSSGDGSYGGVPHGGVGRVGGKSGGDGGTSDPALLPQAGAGSGGGGIPSSSGYHGGGAGHGGAGMAGTGTYSGAGGGSYGQAAIMDISGGSGGAGGAGNSSATSPTYGAAGGAGGGALLLLARGQMTLGGSINVSGGGGGYSNQFSWSRGFGGGGSGGSVAVAAKSISLTGFITADGGVGGWESGYGTFGGYYLDAGGHGAGGRVALYYQQGPTPSTSQVSVKQVTITNNSGTVTSTWNSSGTIFRNGVDEAGFRYPVNLVTADGVTVGTLDPTFNGDGIQTTTLTNAAGTANVSARAYTMKVQPDGKVVVAGFVNRTTQDALVARYNVDGSLDSSFGTGGMTIIDAGGKDVIYEMILLSDGSILGVGETANGAGTNQDASIWKLTSAGVLDSTFGTGGRVRTAFDLGSPNTDLWTRVVVMPSGDIIAGGYGYTSASTSTMIIARFTSAGAPVNSYGTSGNGKVTLSFGGGDENLLAAALDSGGRLVVGGTTKVGTQYDCALARLTTAGVLDATFGISGKVTVAVGAGYDEISDLLVQPDGKIFALGTFKNPTYYDLVGLRFNSDGTLDSTFDGDGKRSYQVGTLDDLGKSVVMQSDGKYVLSGYYNNGTNEDMHILRINADGSLDTTFNGNGIVTLAPGPQNDRIYQAAVAPDGKIVAAGLSDDPTSTFARVAVIRLIGDQKPGVWNLAAAQAASTSGVSVTGQVDPGGSSTTVSLEYGLTASLGSTQSLGTFTGNGAQNLSALLDFAGLAKGTTLYYRVVSTNANGTTTTTTQSLSIPYTFELIANLPGGTGADTMERGPMYAAADGTLYGVSNAGGTNGLGTLFKVSPTGTMTVLINFTGTSGAALGSNPAGGVVYDGAGNLWGTARAGGASGGGTIYKYNIASGTLTTLQSFTGTTGAVRGRGPYRELVADAAGFYWGMTYLGGTNDKGTVFKINKSTGAFATIADFAGTTTAPRGEGGDQALTFDGTSTMWGVTSLGGAGNFGTLFKINTSTGALTTMKEFTGTTGSVLGTDPDGGLLFDGSDVLWGTTYSGGSHDAGTTFKYTISTNTFTNLFSMNGGAGTSGSNPVAVFYKDDTHNLMWGSTATGGTANLGTVFTVDRSTPTPTSFSTALHFTGAGTSTGVAAGRRPYGALQTDGLGNLIGTTTHGGPADAGVIYRIRFGPTPVTLAATQGAAVTLNGTVNPNGPATTCYFEYGTAPGSLTSTTITQNLAGGTAVTNVSATFTDLVLGQTYYYRLRADNAEQLQPQYGQVQSFVVQTGSYTYTDANQVPLTSNGFTATGKAIDLSLGYAPAAGTELMVVKNTGLSFISGQLNNLAQGQTVTLSYAGINYSFVANYYGGTGNDLVLVWKNTKPWVWGRNEVGQIGDGTTTVVSPFGKLLPTATSTAGVLAGKTLISMSASRYHNLAVCSDGTLVSWGANSSGQLGNNSTTNSSLPVGVTTSGVLSGKTVIAVAAGNGHSLALSSDGTVAAWGSNQYGQLGNNSTTNSSVPVSITGSGVLSGKTVVAVAAGGFHSMALCSDGTVATWGDNTSGVLGNGSTTQSLVPVTVVQSGVLSGKTVVSVSAGGNHSLALCSDGTVATWGTNGEGQLGTSSVVSSSSVPVAVNTGGVLSGKTVVAATSGAFHSIVLCSDGTVATWGRNAEGQLGNNSAVTSNVPVAVTTSGLLSGKTVTSVTAGYTFAGALCSDGTVAAWGDNSNGQLGNNSTTSSLVPVAVSTAPFAAGERLSRITAGTMAYDTLALVASPPVPVVNTLAATGITSTGATLNGTVDPSGNDSTVTFEYGLTTSYDNSVTAIPAVLIGSGTMTAYVELTGLQPNTPYHYRVRATSAAGTSYGSDFTFTTLSNVTATYTSATDVPVTTSSFNATGRTLTLSLGYAPAAGTELMVVKNTGLPFISGQFSNLAQGQTVTLNYQGVNYDFVANYYGGTGNDLVLVWKNTQPWGWGYNLYGQLGNNSTTQSLVPVAVSNGGVLSGKTVVALTAGSNHSLALCSDGTLAAWGYNGNGQLGNNSTTNSPVPVAVSNGGVLTGKTVVAVAAGNVHSLALCSDGTMAAWGNNDYGQLGNNSTTQSLVPVAVVQSGVLSGKTVVAVAAGSSHSLALCSDGTLAAWGYNFYGQLGNNSTTNSSVPVAVSNGGVLTGKTVVAVAAGSSHSLALCSDGTLANWGANFYGQLGNNSTTNSPVPVAVVQSGVLTGKTVAAVVAGGNHSLALCSDGALAAWGYNGDGELGSNSTAQSLVPVAVSSSSLVSGQRFVSAASGSSAVHSLALAASPPTPVITTLTATAITGTAATLNGTVNPKDNDTSVFFDYGLTPTYGSTIAAFPQVVTGSGVLVVNAALTGLSPGTVYHFRVRGTSNAGTSTGGDMIVVTTLPDLTYTYNSSSGVPVTAEAVNAAGATVNLTLNFAPATGTSLTVINNTGLGFINGTFSNLAQGQTVTLNYAGVNYNFVANYYGGTGNDLVLVWQDTKSWTWGYNGNGQLGNNSTTQSLVPVAVVQSGVLAGKTVVATAAGNSYSMALCSDGTLAAWGYNGQGQLGNNSNTTSLVPVGVSTSGVLAGKTIVAVAAGYSHSLALCSDGTLAAWGNNGNGQLGNNSTTQSSVPVAVNTSGVLAGKSVVAIAAGDSHSLALCSDGTLAAWGRNDMGQLGNSSTTQSSVPVAVTQSGVLAGKTVVAMAAGYYHSLALCSDGTLAAWGNNSSGQLGNNSTTQSTVPVAVTQSGVLAGKSVVATAAGNSHSLALCSDGTLVAWGYNNQGQLGNNSTTQSIVPTLVSTSTLAPGQGFTRASSGATAIHSMALVVAPLPPIPTATSLAATSITTTGATLNGTVNASGSSTAVTFDYGTTTAYGSTIAGTPTPLTGSSTTAVSAALTGLTPGTTYHFRVTGTSVAGFANGADFVFTTISNNANLASLTLSDGTLSPSFASNTLTYSATVANNVTSLTLTPAVQHPAAIVKMNNVIPNGSATVNLSIGLNSITVLVTAEDGTQKTYTLTVTRQSAVETWRQQYFGTSSNSGNAADNADPDGDGLSNYLEWACNLNPTTSGTLNTPLARNGAIFEYTYTRSVAALNAGVTFTVEWSDTLPGTSWSSAGVTEQILSDNGTVQQVKASVPVGSSGRRFVHLTVSGP